MEIRIIHMRKETGSMGCLQREGEEKDEECILSYDYILIAKVFKKL